MTALLQRLHLSSRKGVLRLLAATQTYDTWDRTCGYAADASQHAPFAAGSGAAAAVAVLAAVAAADADQGTTDSSSSSSSRSWFSRFFGSSSSSRSDPQTESQHQQQQQQWAVPPGELLSGAIPALSDDGLTNHPLDYNPITNEHTAAMTLAKQAGLEAYQAGRYSEAEHRFQESLHEARLGFPIGDPHIPSAQHCLAELYRNTGQLDKAQELYEQAAADLLEHLGDRHWMYAAALASLAQCHEAKQDYDKAITLLEQALELRRQLFSAGSYLYAIHLAVVLLKRQAAAAGAAAGSSEAGNSSGSSSQNGSGVGSWFGLLKRDGAAGGDGVVSSNDVIRAIDLLQQAVKIVEEAGQVQETPAAAWLAELAAAHGILHQQTAAVDCLKKSLQYMALPRLTEEQRQQQQLRQAQRDGSVEGEAAPGSSSSTGPTSEASDDLAVQRLKIMAQGSEVAERLVDAQLAAGDIAGARNTMRQAVEARMVLHGRHLVVAKSMTRLSRLLLQPPVDPEAPALATHYAASAVAIAEHALQGAQRANLWSGLLHTLTQGGPSRTRAEAEKASGRLQAAMQLGSACLALANAEQLSGQSAAAESALRKAVTQLRWVLGVGTEDTDRLSKEQGVEPAQLERVAGLLVDLKLLQMDCLEALAAQLRQKQTSHAQPDRTGHTSSSSSNPSAGGPIVQPSLDGSEECKMLLGEAELLAAELYAD